MNTSNIIKNNTDISNNLKLNLDQDLVRFKSHARFEDLLKTPVRAVSIYKNAPLSVKKLRHIANLVRGKSYSFVIMQLLHLRKKGAFYIKKCLESAGANCSNNTNINPQNLKVHVNLGKGRTLKRLNYRAKGRADKILIKYTDISIALYEEIDNKILNSESINNKILNSDSAAAA